MMTEFMERPLVVWVQSLQGEPLTYDDLTRGGALNKLLQEIDPRAVSHGVDSLPGDDVKELLENWDLLLKNIKAYYHDILQQLIVMRLPDITAICREPASEEARAELEQVMLLILGCAVQCDNKEHFIDGIKHLNINTQQAIVDSIKEITDDSKNVFALDMPPELMDDVSRSMHAHLARLVVERDAYVEAVKQLTATVEDLTAAVTATQASSGVGGSGGRASSTPPRGRDAATPDKLWSGGEKGTDELAEAKALVRKLRDELQDQLQAYDELQEEVDEQKSTVSKLRAENLSLTKNASAARTYLDELDIVREKVSRVDKAEAEILKYKEKLNELDFYKSRVEELRADNSVLLETRATLQAQLEASHQRIETVVALEEELLLVKQELSHYSQERDDDRQRIQELVEENTKLKFDNKSSFNESASLEEELNKARHHSSPGGGMSNTLSEQLNETANTRILRLELENQNLKKQLQEVGETQLLDSATKVLELEKENRRLGNKVDKLQSERQQYSQGNIALEQTTSELSREKKELAECLETVKESSERQVRELECEKEQLEQLVDTLRQRNEATQDLRVKDTERENKKLHDSVKNLKSQVSSVTQEHRQLQKAHEQLKTTAQKFEHLQEENHGLEHSNEVLQKEVTMLKLSCDQYEQIEQQYLDIEVERDKLLKTVERLKKTCTKIDHLEEENSTLKVESNHLKRMVENMKNSSSHVADLEQDKDRMNREIQQLKRALDGSVSDRSKQEQLEVDLLELDTDNQRLERKVEALSRRVAELEQDNTELDNHTDSLQKNLETMRISLRKLDDIEEDNKEMEKKVTLLTKEKALIEKDNKKLKQSVDLFEVQVDDMTYKMTAMDRENKTLRRQAEHSKEMVAKVKELEAEKLEVAQQASMDRKTLNTLREELVKEKIHAQDMSNEVERLGHELENKEVGVSIERHQLSNSSSSDYTRSLENLELRLEGGLKQSMELKEEKISSLESRLEAARKHNLKVQEELNSVRQDYEVVVQQNQELMQASLSGKPHRLRHQQHTEVPNATKEMLKLKDHIITLERTNASLEEEAKHLKSTADGFKLQTATVQVENSKYQSQMTSLHTQYNMLQTQCAKLQVENKALQSQFGSLSSQVQASERRFQDLKVEHENLVAEYSNLQYQQEVASTDNHQLSKIHDKLATEYEALISEHGSLKANFKAIKAEHKNLADELSFMAREKETVSQIKEMMDQGKESMLSDSQLKLDYVRMKEDLMLTQHEKDKARAELEALEEEHRALRGEHNQLKQQYGRVSDHLSEARDQVGQLNMETTSLLNKLDSVTALNEKLEDDNRNLMMQLQALLNQNQELLTGCLDSKDKMAEEQKAYIERLAELRRQKEKLEEKIMEQYRRYDPVKKKSRGFGNFMKKARQLVKGGNRKESRSKLDDSPENTSIGSGDQNPKLSQRNKHMAKSTTALNFTQDGEGRNASAFSMRAAKSSENLNFGLENHHGDHSSSHSSSPGNQRNTTTEWQQTPIRSRQVLESSSVSSLGQGSSSRIGSVAMPEDDSDSEMTLEQFLRECDKSPKSRKKMIREMKEQEKVEQKKARRSNTPKPEPETMVLSPDLGPRAATIDQVEQTTTRASPFKSKSEMNLSKLSTYSSGSSMDHSDHRYSPMTSSRVDLTNPATPNKEQYPRNGHNYQASPNRNIPTQPQENYNHTNSMPRQNSSNSGSSIGSYNAVTRTTNNMVRSQTLGPGFSPVTNSNQSPRGNDRSYLGAPPQQPPSSSLPPSSLPSSSLPSSSLPSSSARANPIRRATTPGSQYRSNTPPPPTAMQYSTDRKNIELSPPNHPPPPPPTQQHQQQQQHHQPQQQHHQQQHHQPPQHHQQQQQQQQQPPHRSPEQDSSYSPGNVRNLVQNFQINMNSSVSTSNGVNGGSGGPTPPPRRSRPMSAGPLRSSSNSAFSVPRPSTPTSNQHQQYLERNTGRALPRRPEDTQPQRGGVLTAGLVTPRTLPRTPDDPANIAIVSPGGGGKMAAPAAPPPARPQSQGPPRDGGTVPPKNSTWYEYGCV